VILSLGVEYRVLLAVRGIASGSHVHTAPGWGTPSAVVSFKVAWFGSIIGVWTVPLPNVVSPKMDRAFQ